MKTLIATAFAAACTVTAFVQPALACANGYAPVWIQGHKICKIKTPNLPLKAKTGPELNKTRALKAG